MASRKSPQGSPTPEAAPPAFESSLRRLGEIVEALEGGELPLEESLRLFEEGVRLARIAQDRLDQAERRVEELLSIDESGAAELRQIPVEP